MILEAPSFAYATPECPMLCRCAMSEISPNLVMVLVTMIPNMDVINRVQNHVMLLMYQVYHMGRLCQLASQMHR